MNAGTKPFSSFMVERVELYHLFVGKERTEKKKHAEEGGGGKSSFFMDDAGGGVLCILFTIYTVHHPLSIQTAVAFVAISLPVRPFLNPI